jgi:multidrug efflux pump subunit AcrA (membrane-fusion protein)
MARQKRISTVVEKAQQRLAALTSVDPALDFGNNLSITAYRAEAADAQAKLDAYNTLLSQVDEAYNAFQSAEKSLRDLSERMLAGVASKYGKDSNQYEMAGGVRKSERKRPVRKKTAA